MYATRMKAAAVIAVIAIAAGGLVFAACGNAQAPGAETEMEDVVETEEPAEQAGSDAGVGEVANEEAEDGFPGETVGGDVQDQLYFDPESFGFRKTASEVIEMFPEMELDYEGKYGYGYPNGVFEYNGSEVCFFFNSPSTIGDEPSEENILTTIWSPAWFIFPKLEAPLSVAELSGIVSRCDVLTEYEGGPGVFLVYQGYGFYYSVTESSTDLLPDSTVLAKLPAVGEESIYSEGE